MNAEKLTKLINEKILEKSEKYDLNVMVRLNEDEVEEILKKVEDGKN